MHATFVTGLCLGNAALAAACGYGFGRLRRSRTAGQAVSSGAASTPAGVLDDVAAAVEAGSRGLEAGAAEVRAADADQPRLRRGAVALLRSGRVFEGRLDRGRDRLNGLFEAAEACRRTADAVGRHRDRVGAFCGGLERQAADPLADAVAILSATADLAEHTSRLARELEETKARLADRETRLGAAERDARLDPLTRLANRRAFEERLAECGARLGRGLEGYSVAVFDLDAFKAVNDTYGHAAGDAALQVFARVLTASVRPYDLSARLGGEEFAVVLAGADLEAGRAAAERVRKAAERTSVRHGETRVTFTVSGGVAEAEPGEPSDDLLGRADAALYAAKTAGRNRVELAKTGAAAEVPAGA